MIKLSITYLFELTQMDGLILLGIPIAGLILFFVLNSAVVFAHGFQIFDNGMLPITLAMMALLLTLSGCVRHSLNFFIYTRKNKF